MWTNNCSVHHCKIQMTCHKTLRINGMVCAEYPCVPDRLHYILRCINCDYWSFYCWQFFGIFSANIVNRFPCKFRRKIITAQQYIAIHLSNYDFAKKNDCSYSGIFTAINLLPQFIGINLGELWLSGLYKYEQSCVRLIQWKEQAFFANCALIVLSNAMHCQWKHSASIFFAIAKIKRIIHLLH